MKTNLEHFNGTTILSFLDFARYSQRTRVPAWLWRFIFLLQKIICTSNPQQCEIKESNIYKVYTREWLLLLLLLQWRQLHREAAGFSATLSSPAMLKPFELPFTHPPHPPLSNCKEFPEWRLWPRGCPLRSWLHTAPNDSMLKLWIVYYTMCSLLPPPPPPPWPHSEVHCFHATSVKLWKKSESRQGRSNALACRNGCNNSEQLEKGEVVE